MTTTSNGAQRLAETIEEFANAKRKALAQELFSHLNRVNIADATIDKMSDKELIDSFLCSYRDECKQYKESVIALAIPAERYTTQVVKSEWDIRLAVTFKHNNSKYHQLWLSVMRKNVDQVEIRYPFAPPLTKSIDEYLKSLHYYTEEQLLKKIRKNKQRNRDREPAIDATA